MLIFKYADLAQWQNDGFQAVDRCSIHRIRSIILNRVAVRLAQKSCHQGLVRPMMSISDFRRPAENGINDRQRFVERLIVVAGHLRDNKRRMARSDFAIRDGDFLAKPCQLLRSVSVECES
jgi:hypothetical protein